jgi:lambda repressor-like predicted transcriptional regulator
MTAAEVNGTTADEITDLKGRWDQLKDVDRAGIVHKIHRAGTSLRALARTLVRSEALMRNLNLAAQAPSLDRILARQGKISIRELVRRAKADLAARRSKARDAAERDRERKSEAVAKAICDLLDRVRWGRTAGEQFLEEARWYLASAEAARKVPQQVPPSAGLPLSQLLERVRPQYMDSDSIDVEMYAEWIVKFVVAALPDSSSRHQALEMALEAQIGAPISIKPLK